MVNRFFAFKGGPVGLWKVTTTTAVSGEGLPSVDRIDVVESPTLFTKIEESSTWCLQGVVSNERYVTRTEKVTLAGSQPPLGRTEATYAAFIAISKTSEWWGFTQDERRSILETTSRHIATGLKYLPAVARRLHHSRDLGEPFDFLTWFEFAPSDSVSFDQLLEELRTTEEWQYVNREFDVRLIRESSN
ncbi:MAG: chlorite dismutase family protein [Planctomycetota bacterium]|nr:chlorite dismutase family protein [Planctomycetota bacterium]